MIDSTGVQPGTPRETGIRLAAARIGAPRGAIPRLPRARDLETRK